MNVTMWTKIAVSASAALLILYYVIGREVDLSAELVALAALAALPWLPSMIDSMELPGGTKGRAAGGSWGGAAGGQLGTQHSFDVRPCPTDQGVCPRA